MPSKCGQAEAYKVVIKAGHDEGSNLALPHNLQNLSLTVAIGSQATETKIGALIQSESSGESVLSLALSISGVSWYPLNGVQYCLQSPNATSKILSLELSNVQTYCQLQNLSLSSALFSSVTASCPIPLALNNSFYRVNSREVAAVTVEDAVQAQCEAWTLNAIEQATLSFLNAVFRVPLAVHLARSSNVSIASTTFYRSIGLDVSDINCFIDVRNSTFEGPFEIDGHRINTEAMRDRSTDKDDTHVFMRSSRIRHGIVMIAPYLRLDMQENSFSTSEVPVIIPAPNFWLNASLAAVGILGHNDFVNGTAYLVLPAHTGKPLAECQDIFNSFAKLRIRANRFQAFSANSSLTAFFDTDCKIPSSYFHKIVIDATHNWWGHSGGPRLCCNPNGGGGYTSQFIRPDYWCLDAECRTFAQDSLKDLCVTRCCPMEFGKDRRILFIGISAITYLILLTGMVGVTFYIKRNYGPSAFERSTRTDLINKLSPSVYLSLILSSISCIGVFGIAGMLAIPYWTDSRLPRQATVQATGIMAGAIFGFDVIFQLLMNLALAIALWKRNRWPKLLRFLSSKLFVMNCINVVYILVLAFIWVSYIAIMPPTCYAPKTYFYAFNISFGRIASFEANSTTLFTIALAPIAFYSIVVMIPLNALNQVLYQFEYVCINTAVETTLGEDLARSPKLNAQGRRLRVLAFFPLALTIAILGMSIHCMVNNPSTPIAALLSPGSLLVWGFPRFANTAGCALIGIIVCSLAIYISFSYNRPTLITTLTYISIIIGIAIADFNLAEIVAALALPREDFLKAFILHGAFQVVGNLDAIFLFVLAALLYRFGSSVIEIIPTVARNNLNQHLDRTWASHNSQDFVSTYLTEDAYAPLIGSDREY